MRGVLALNINAESGFLVLLDGGLAVVERHTIRAAIHQAFAAIAENQDRLNRTFTLTVSAALAPAVSVLWIFEKFHYWLQSSV